MSDQEFKPERIAFDYSSFAWTALLGGKDEENGFEVTFQDKPKWINSALYGYDRMTERLIERLDQWNLPPERAILVIEGKGSKLPRKVISSDYKGESDKAPDSYTQFMELREHMIETWRGLGATIIIQDNAEADDVMGWLAENTEENLVICSGDNDISWCNRDRNAYGAEVQVQVNDLVGVNKFSVDSGVMWDFEFIPTYKALVGKDGEVPGVHRFGPKAFGKLVTEFGLDGLQELQEMLEKGSLDELHDMVDESKTIKLLVDNEKIIVDGYKLAKIRPEWVNTMKDPLQFLAGMVKPPPAEFPDPRLQRWYGQRTLVTADNYDAAYAQVKKLLRFTVEPTFDIETSTPQESDDWLEHQGAGPEVVDTLGSVLTGFSITCGDNHQHTFYVSVDHKDTKNVTMVQARLMIELLKDMVIHNTNFELPVIYQAEDEDGTLWRDLWKDNGYNGFLPGAQDTKFEASYVNENERLGLKHRSKLHLDYEQTSFETVTQKSGVKGTLPKGGRLISQRPATAEDPGAEPLLEAASAAWDAWEAAGDQDAPTPPLVMFETRQYKMNQLTALEVFDYGCDDTITTAGIHNFFKLHMQLEHHWHVQVEVEIDAAYQHAKNFIDGMPVSIQKCKELERLDDKVFHDSWTIVREYLIAHGWAGTVPPVFTPDLASADIKLAYRIVNDLVPGGFSYTPVEEDEDGDPVEVEDAAEDEDSGPDEFLKTRTRKPEKMAQLARSLGHEVFAGMLERCIAGEHEVFTEWVNSHFKGEPQFKFSSKQMGRLMYDIMKLPVVVRGKVSDKMRKEGIRQGNPSTNELAIKYALRDGPEEVKAVLEGLRLMKMVATRRSLYYSKYPNFVHWKTGRIHGSHNQCQTNTRRASESKPNKQQLPKNEKLEGQSPRFREVVVPHHEDAVIVSMDFDSQELRVIADYSQDTNMLACYAGGENDKSMHILTGLGILYRRHPDRKDVDYEYFKKAHKDKTHADHILFKEIRELGKKTNFTTEFGAMAPKLAATLLVSESDAQDFIDAREAAFPEAARWKKTVIAEAKRCGYVRTKKGAKRHLRDALRSADGWLKLKAERQAVNFQIQSSSAEMTKLAEGRVWRERLTYIFDAICIGPIHDELVFSVAKKDLHAFIKRAHWCMVQPYADMTVPIVSSISFGPDFKRQIEIGDQPTDEAINEGLAELATM